MGRWGLLLGLCEVRGWGHCWVCERKRVERMGGSDLFYFLNLQCHSFQFTWHPILCDGTCQWENIQRLFADWFGT